MGVLTDQQLDSGALTKRLKTRLGLDAASPVTPTTGELWVSALRNIDTRPINVVALGDSTTDGVTGSASLLDRWTYKVQTSLNTALGLPVPAGESYVSTGGSATYNGVAPVTRSGGSAGNTFGPSRREWRWTSAGGATFTVTGTHARIHYGRVASTAQSWRYRVDGGSWTTVTLASGVAQNFVTDAIALGVSGSHTVEVEWISGTVAIAGLEVWDGNTAKGIRVINSGHGSWAASNFTGADASVSGPLPERLAGADLITIMLGANDQSLGKTTEQFRADMNALLLVLRDPDRGCPSAGIVVTALYNYAEISTVTWAQWVTQMRRVALANGATFLDLRGWMPNCTGAGVNYADTIHMTPAGQTLLADIYTQVLLDGAGVGMPASAYV